MQQDFQHTHDLLSRDKKDRRARDKALPDESPDEAPNLPIAGFALLADPSVISGAGDTPSDMSSEDEVDRLRQALQARSRELAALQEGRTSQQDRLPVPTDQRDAALLNSTQARQLAMDARQREQSIRDELLTAREALVSTPPNPNAPPADSRPESVHDRASQGHWQTRALVRGHEAVTTKSFTGTDEANLRAETRELQATLNVARNTTRTQKNQIAALRKQLAETQQDLARSFEAKGPLESRVDGSTRSTLAGSANPDQLQRDPSELTRLRDRLRLNSREAEARDAERILLQRTLEERESELTAQRTQIDDLNDRLEVQADALGHARNQSERERSRNTASQQLLAQLRTTLVDDLSHHSDRAVDVTGQRLATADSSAVVDPQQDESQTGSTRHLEIAGPTTSARITEFDTRNDHFVDEWRDCITPPRPLIFDAWQDDQIRRHFGPMGIDTIIDLLRAPLARRSTDGRAETHLVLIGRTSSRWAATLAEGLIQNGTPPFVIHVCDPDAQDFERALGLAHDHPIREFLRDLPFPETPDALRDLLEEIEPQAVLSRDFLSTETDVEPWLEVFGDASRSGTCLLFSERTGVGPMSAPDEISAIGDRIWDRMPDRYTRLSDDERRYSNWQEAMRESQRAPGIVPANNLLSKLRSRFRLEMLARFGFLAEPFVASRIGENFDVQATRDRIENS